MRHSRLLRKLLAIFASLSAVLIIGLIGTWLVWQRSARAEARRAQLYQLADVIRAGLPPLERLDTAQQRMLASTIEHYPETMSMVLVDAAGQVLASTPQYERQSPNFSGSAEIQQALREQRPTDQQRWSPILQRTMHYVALPLIEDGRTVGALRVGMEVDRGPTAQTTSVIRIWMLGLVAWLTGCGIIYVALARAVRPLERLTRRAQAIAAGDEPTERSYTDTDEIGLLGAAIDDMRAKRAGGLVALREKSELLGSLLGNMVEGVIAVGPDELVLIANTASGRMLGFSAAGAAGRPLFELTRSLPLHEAVLESFRLGRAVNSEFDAPGSPRRILAIRAAPLAAEPRAGVMVVLHDVTELRRLENLRREFVANVSHELKTPLASIKAYAETLRLGALDDAEHRLEFVSRIEEQGERLHQLILDLLHLARVEAGQAALELVEVPLAQAVDECVERFRDVAAARGTRLHVESSDETLAVIADEEGLSTILSNLVDNAIKYTPPGGDIAIAWRRVEQGFVQLAVRDTGIGIAPRDQARVFERFFRADKARSRELGGTGLGLSIVKHLAQALGGDVDLVSQVGVGSTFFVRLPLAGPVGSSPPAALRSSTP